MGIPKIAARARTAMPAYVALLLWSDDGHKANRASAGGGKNAAAAAAAAYSNV